MLLLSHGNSAIELLRFGNEGIEVRHDEIGRL
jgi:hypothetical protein